MASTTDHEHDPAPRPKRRTFPAEYKLRIVAEYDAAPNGEKGAILRRERLYHSHIIEWRAARDAGARARLVDKRTSPARPRKAAGQGELERLRQKVARLEAGGTQGRRLGAHGKSQRALGTALRERGLKHEAERVLDEVFPGLEQALSTAAACRLTGRARATHYRRLSPPVPTAKRPRPTPASALSAHERAAVLALLNRPEYADLPPAQVWARELDAGRYHCSVRTMYRILAAAGQNGERRRQATHPAKTVPQLVATAPCQVLTWDITKIKGPDKGEWYHLYVIIDIYSRYIAGHTVERAESAQRAEELIRETIERNGIVPQTVHADRGTSMTSKKVSQLLIDLGVTRSHSRPKVSNDNPYSEANFKTIKYCGEYPASFNSLTHARTWCEDFISYYNHEHRHSGIGLHTPASVHFGTAELVREQRAVTLADAYARHPERFAHRPKPPAIPEHAWINEPKPETEPAPQYS